MKHRVNGTKIVPESSLPEISIRALSGREYMIQDGSKVHRAFLVSEDRTSKMTTWWIDGYTYEVHSQSPLEELLESMGMGAVAQSGADHLKAPMPGLVLSVHVKAGQAVTKGDTLIVLEAMKMENALKAPHDGVIDSVQATAGSAVEKGAVLLAFQK
ncbi:MAG: biotin/lipoyl-binding protein [Schleiferiaceae bacterium]|nr:biotin/lipoyl-binding protein [Schleiferiaceae bacterium]